jgi:hypothetical protein
MSLPNMSYALRLDIDRLVKSAKRYGGETMRWVWTRDGERSASISVRLVCLSEVAGNLMLDFNANGRPFSQAIRVIAEPCRFGGRRWFAFCPAQGWKSQKLYHLGSGFYSRKSYGRHTYASRLDPHQRDRDLRRRDRLLVGKLKSTDPDFIPKPKWMRWKTYNALAAQHWCNEEALDRHLSGLMLRLGKELL